MPAPRQRSSEEITDSLVRHLWELFNDGNPVADEIYEFIPPEEYAALQRITQTGEENAREQNTSK